MSTTAVRSDAATNVTTTAAFWERLWQTSGIQFLVLFIIAYIIYGYQPQVGASADALVAFYDGERTRIMIAAVVSGMAVLNLLWFAAALRTTRADHRRGPLHVGGRRGGIRCAGHELVGRRLRDR